VSKLSPPAGVRNVSPPSSTEGANPVLRSLLFVPGDSERKQAKAVDCGADALLLDLEDSVAAAQLPAARQRVRELLTARTDRSQQQLWVRVNALSSGILLQDLVAVFSGVPDGIVLPKPSSPGEVAEVSNYLTALEAQAGRDLGSTKLLVIATETPQALLTLSSYGQVLPAGEMSRQRLAGLTWGSEDLSAAMGITHKTDRQGSLTFTFQLARSLCVVTAAALGVRPSDSTDARHRILSFAEHLADSGLEKCFGFWRARHNNHHVHCQEVGGDPDVFGLSVSAFVKSDWASGVARFAI